jgi:hypothetical protein
MAVFKKEHFPSRLAPGDLAITLNMRVEELVFLAREEYGNCFYTNDVDALEGENSKSNIEQIYLACGLSAPQSFTSLAVRIYEEFSDLDKTLRNYGPVVLEVDLSSIESDLVVFNGDVKNLAMKTEITGDISWAFRIDHTKGVDRLESELRDLADRKRSINNLRPRRVGEYFEARIGRPLTPRDIKAIYCADPGAFQHAEYICSLAARV